MTLLRRFSVLAWSSALIFFALPGPQQSDCAAAANPGLCSLAQSSEYSGAVKAFYAAVNYNLVWSKDNHPTTQALALIQLLQNAAKQGLRIEDYDTVKWNEEISHLPQSTTNAARFDLDFTAAVLRYMSDVSCGRVDPSRMNFHLNRGKACTFSEFLRMRVINAADVGSALKEIEPPYAGYERTKQALAHYLNLANEGEGEALPPIRKTLQPGDAYSGLSALEHRLNRFGDLATDKSNPPQSNLYSGAVVDAVKHFQERHGLPADGSIDPATYKHLTVPLKERIRQLQLALERWRWAPANLPSRLIMVNIPEFTLRAYNNHHSELSMRVIVGRSFHGRETPVFQDEMEYVIFRPYWNVPTKIVRKELIPDMQKKPEFMAKHQYEMIDSKGQVIDHEEINPATLQQLRAGKLRIRQEPGPENSLGLIKFVFPNNYDVYLHGTPEQKLFSRSRRDFSHGCIRVEDPATLAQWVLRDLPGWTREKIESAMQANKSQQVNLAHPIPVLIVYGTAFVEENGEVHFFDDIYGQDAKLERALDHSARSGLTKPGVVVH